MNMATFDLDALESVVRRAVHAELQAERERIVSQPRCRSKTKNGTQCSFSADGPDGFCLVHRRKNQDAQKQSGAVVDASADGGQ